ncbi:MAG: hypothetical protein LUH58_01405 [Lachnospiraceae bacterium]|nr:hypothetical protein [Lachnospiraceae bacterium]
MSHVLPTPHAWDTEHTKTKEDEHKNAVMLTAIEKALVTAITQAKVSKTEALFGFGVGQCYGNINRNVKTADGWWLGENEEGPVDRTVSVFRFERMDGTPIAILFNYNAQASVLDDVYTLNNERLISSDFIGVAGRFVENELGNGVVAAYLLGIGGDLAPAAKGYRSIVGKDGKRIIKEARDNAYMLAEMLGERLGQEVLRIDERISCAPLDGPLKLMHRAVTLKGQVIPPTETIIPRNEYRYIPAEDVTTPVEAVSIGDAVLLGIKPEMCCRSLQYIKEKSPFMKLAVMTFVNGGAKYMPESDMYDMITFQAMNSRFAKGSAEIFRDQVVHMLEEFYISLGN